MAQSNVNPTTIRQRYPTLLADWDDADDIRLLVQNIEDAEADIEWGGDSLRERAISALVAHRMLLRGQEADGDTGASLILSRSSAGQVSVDFVVPPPDFVPLEYHHYYTTKPGMEYVELLRRVVGGGMRLVS